MKYYLLCLINCELCNHQDKSSYRATEMIDDKKPTRVPCEVTLVPLRDLPSNRDQNYINSTYWNICEHKLRMDEFLKGWDLTLIVCLPMNLLRKSWVEMLARTKPLWPPLVWGKVKSYSLKKLYKAKTHCGGKTYMTLAKPPLSPHVHPPPTLSFFPKIMSWEYFKISWCFKNHLDFLHYMYFK